MLAIIGGSGFKDFEHKDVIFIQRHGNNIPPHKINHQENITKLKQKGVKQIIAICSVGSLKLEIQVGAIVIPDDYINFNTSTIFNNKAIHTVPSLDTNLRNKIMDSAKKLNIETINQGIYFQTKGPRFETKAEINLIKNYADILGMTMASEATIANELGLKYAAICSIDNYANGISNTPLSFDEITKTQKTNKTKTLNILNELI
jgi:5'-methylthioadenosine phosphorylase